LTIILYYTGKLLLKYKLLSSSKIIPQTNNNKQNNNPPNANKTKPKTDYHSDVNVAVTAIFISP
jgi:hypothetical protein